MNYVKAREGQGRGEYPVIIVDRAEFLRFLRALDITVKEDLILKTEAGVEVNRLLKVRNDAATLPRWAEMLYKRGKHVS